MNYTQEKFERAVITATNANADIYDIVSPRFLFTEMNISQVLTSPVPTEHKDIAALVEDMVYLKTFIDMIPEMDLVLTATGFGVVSNENVVPASADRVNRLKEMLTFRYEDLYDCVLLRLTKIEAWGESYNANSNIRFLFYLAEDLTGFFPTPHPHRSDIIKLNDKLFTSAKALMGIISPELYRRLLTRIRCGQCNDLDRELIELSKRFIAQHIADQTACTVDIMMLNRLLDDNLDEFTEYYNSSTYRAKIKQLYENQKTDRTFFFG